MTKNDCNFLVAKKGCKNTQLNLMNVGDRVNGLKKIRIVACIWNALHCVEARSFYQKNILLAVSR